MREGATGHEGVPPPLPGEWREHDSAPDARGTSAMRAPPVSRCDGTGVACSRAGISCAAEPDESVEERLRSARSCHEIGSMSQLLPRGTVAENILAPQTCKSLLPRRKRRASARKTRSCAATDGARSRARAHDAGSRASAACVAGGPAACKLTQGVR